MSIAPAIAARWILPLAAAGLAAIASGALVGAGCSEAPDAGSGLSYCGDGTVELPETCDDGNTTDGDGCSADCASNETCGNGIVDVTRGERCDDGNTTDGDGCAAHCDSDERCGNGILDLALGEQCDDGNTADGDGCPASCHLLCGNGVIDPGEECDGGGGPYGACDVDCTAPRCGDGVVNPAAGEQCDDGNADPTDGCTDACQYPTCGDGIVHVGAEQCDDGNRANGDGCGACCTVPMPTTPGWKPWEIVAAPQHPWGAMSPTAAVTACGDIIVAYWTFDAVWARRWLAATQTWEPIVQLDSGSSLSAGPEVAVDEAGDAIVVWSTGVGRALLAARFEAAAGWPSGWSQLEVAPVVPGAQHSKAQVDMTADGSAVITWQQYGPYPHETAHARVYVPGDGWSAAHQLSPSTTVLNVDAGIASLGGTIRVVAAWTELGAGVQGDVLTYDRATHAGTWAGVRRIGEGQSADFPAVGMSDAGNAIVVSPVGDPPTSGSAIEAVHYDGAWHPPVRLPSGGAASETRLSVDRSGDAIVVWHVDIMGLRAAMARRYDGSVWGPAETLLTGWAFPRVAMSGGHAIVAFRYRGPSDPNDSVWGMSFGPGGWTTPRLIEDDVAGTNSDLRVALRRGGGGIAVWMRLWADDSPSPIAGVRYVDD